jgi:hypothetical protein
MANIHSLIMRRKESSPTSEIESNFSSVNVSDLGEQVNFSDPSDSSYGESRNQLSFRNDAFSMTPAFKTESRKHPVRKMSTIDDKKRRNQTQDLKRLLGASEEEDAAIKRLND